MNPIDMAPLNNNCCADMKNFTDLGGKLLALSMDSSLKFLRAAMDIITPAMSTAKIPGLRAVCDIPETDCPPRCVCDINWDACRGEHRQHAIRVTNTADDPVEFRLKATPFSGLTGGSEGILLKPDRLTLKPRESGLFMAEFLVPEEAPSGEFRAEILVQGKYEQCIRVNLTISSPKQCVCEISQGDIPMRIRAHHWYDHFQCVEPCFKPVYRTGQDGSTDPAVGKGKSKSAPATRR